MYVKFISNVKSFLCAMPIDDSEKSTSNFGTAAREKIKVED